jgi:hypothetical protein
MLGNGLTSMHGHNAKGRPLSAPLNHPKARKNLATPSDISQEGRNEAHCLNRHRCRNRRRRITTGCPSRCCGSGQCCAGSPVGGARPCTTQDHYQDERQEISVSGTLPSGGVQIVAEVSREPQGSPTLVRLDPGVSVSKFLAALPAIAAGQNNIDGISIVFSPQADKGTSSAQADLAAGLYVALDVGGHGGKPPLTVFVIHKAAHPDMLPRPQAALASIEFGFRGAGRPHDGELVRFGNHGFLVHMMIGIRARSGAGAREIARLLKAAKDGRAQRLATAFYSFFNVLTHGAYQQEVIRNRPGYWVLACFMDTQDHREHTQLGMERVIRIVK